MTATEESSAFAEAIREQLKLAIEPQEFDSDEFQRDPFPLYKRLRDHHPIYQDLFHKRWVVSRYDDIVAVFQNNDDFDRAAYDPKGEYEFGKKQVFGPNILEYGNSDEHRFLRNVVADQFVGNRLAGFLPFIEQIAREMMGKIWEKSTDDIAKGFSDTGEVELVSQFTTHAWQDHRVGHGHGVAKPLWIARSQSPHAHAVLLLNRSSPRRGGNNTHVVPFPNKRAGQALYHHTGSAPVVGGIGIGQ